VRAAAIENLDDVPVEGAGFFEGGWEVLGASKLYHRPGQ
jgi:hypothetical protein